MTKNIQTIFLSLSLATLVGFAVNQEIELDQFLNGRTRPEFLKNSKNISTVLSKGTKGKVLDVKKFSSGNAGIKMLVTSGPKKGQSYWVYYNKKNPAIKAIESEKKPEEAPVEEIKPDIKPEIKIDTKVETTRDVTGKLDPSEDALFQTVDRVTDLKFNLHEFVKPANTCKRSDYIEKPEVVEEKAEPKVEPKEEPKEEPKVEPNVDPKAEEKVSDSKVEVEADKFQFERVRPRVQNSDENSSLRCVAESTAAYNICFRGDNEENIEGFQLQNYGPNKIVEANEYYINRSFDFSFSDKASSDMRLIVSDSPDTQTSHTTYSILQFFPRKVLPSVKRVGDELHVTLPNGEVVRYNAKTKEIIGGAIEEGKMTQDPATKRARPASLKYNGGGVLIRADKSGDLPFGDIERKDGSSAPSTTTATVSKKGHKDCKIPSKDLWFNDKERNDVLIKPEFSTDEGLDKFLIKKCGFSLF